MSNGNAEKGAAPPGIIARNLTLRFGQRTVFENLSFTIEGGNFAALLGASGVGKTSLLKMVAGLENPASGTICGSDGLPLEGRIAYMGQKDLLYPWLTIGENITLSSRLRGEKADREWALHLLERVGLKKYGHALPAALSGGMRQRAALARTLYQRKSVVLMDEPFSALDAITRTTIQTLAAELLARHTVLLITHDPLEACRLSHQLMVLSAPPYGLDNAHPISGIPPRAPDNVHLLHSQGKLLQQLIRAAE